MKIIQTTEVADLHLIAPRFDLNLKLTEFNSEGVLPDEAINRILQGLNHYEELLKRLGLKFSLTYLPTIRNRLSKTLNYDQISDELEILNVRIEDELKDIVFGFIPKEKVKYFEQEALFGKEVFDNFKSARDEIKEAGNCYAHGSYTASVFYLMRAVEIGAKAMVSAMKAEKHITVDIFVKGVKKKKKIPIELCDWQKLIGGLNRALSELEKGKATNAKKKEMHSYFSQAVFQFSTIKDAWRNIISHGHEVATDRKFYLAEETSDIMDNTRQFMQHLAKKMKE
jgi:hypothetical protein